MRTKQFYVALSLMVFLIGLLSGCATTSSDTQAEQDTRIARGLIDSMASPIHTFPAGVPR